MVEIERRQTLDRPVVVLDEVQNADFSALRAAGEALTTDADRERLGLASLDYMQRVAESVIPCTDARHRLGMLPLPKLDYDIDALLAAAREGVGERKTRYAFEYRNRVSPEWDRASFSTFGYTPTTREEAVDAMRAMLKTWVSGTEFRLIEITDTVIGFYMTKAPEA